MNLELLPEMRPRKQQPELCIEDFDNIKRRYPQFTKDKKPNYAFACGSGVKLLLDAGYVHGTTIKDASVSDEREHKDLEIYVFDPALFGDKNRNLLDVCGVSFFGPLHKLDYKTDEYRRFGFFVELLNSYYFGFPFPSCDDVKIAVKDRKRYCTLSPEFLVASKLFSHRGLRDIDKQDASALLRRFRITTPYIASIIRKSDFSPVVGDDEDLDNLESRLDDNTFCETIRTRVVTRYQHVVPFVEKLPYNATVSLLQFGPHDMDLCSETKLFVKYQQRRAEEKGGVSKDTDYSVYALGLHYLFQHLNIRHRNADAWTNQILNEVRHDQSKMLTATSGINKILSLLKRKCNPLIYDMMSYTIVEDILSTDFLNVRLAQNLKECSDAPVYTPPP